MVPWLDPVLDLLYHRFWTSLCISVWNKSPLLQLIGAQPLICNADSLLLLLCCLVVGPHQSHLIACRISFLNPPFPHKPLFPGDYCILTNTPLPGVFIPIFQWKYCVLFLLSFSNSHRTGGDPNLLEVRPVPSIRGGGGLPTLGGIKDFVPCVHSPRHGREGLQPPA